MRQVVTTLRLRFQECRRAGAPLSTWRELQLEILAAAKSLQRSTAQQEQAVRGQTGQPRMALWTLLGDAFWLERDLTRLACMIEEVIAELESQSVCSD